MLPILPAIQGGQSDEMIGNRQIDYDGYMDNPYGFLYDYQDEVFTNGQYYTNYVSLANNTGKTRIFLSFENNKNEGIVWETRRIKPSELQGEYRPQHYR